MSWFECAHCGNDVEGQWMRTVQAYHLKLPRWIDMDWHDVPRITLELSASLCQKSCVEGFLQKLLDAPYTDNPCLREKEYLSKYKKLPNDCQKCRMLRKDGTKCPMRYRCALENIGFTKSSNIIQILLVLDVACGAIENGIFFVGTRKEMEKDISKVLSSIDEYKYPGQDLEKGVLLE